MATTSSSKPTAKYFITYGIWGGPLIGRRMRRVLRSKGYKLAGDCRTADIILAHSAGCWYLPNDIKSKLIIYVGLPLAPATRRTAAQNSRSVIKDFWRTKRIKSAIRYALTLNYYGVTQPRRNISIIRNAKYAKPNIFDQAQTVMISNHDDPWSIPNDMEQFITEHSTWAFISMPGSHDRIWQEPERYVEIVEHYAK